MSHHTVLYSLSLLAEAMVLVFYPVHVQESKNHMFPFFLEWLNVLSTKSGGAALQAAYVWQRSPNLSREPAHEQGTGQDVIEEIVGDLWMRASRVVGKGALARPRRICSILASTAETKA